MSFEEETKYWKQQYFFEVCAFCKQAKEENKDIFHLHKIKEHEEDKGFKIEIYSFGLNCLEQFPNAIGTESQTPIEALKQNFEVIISKIRGTFDVPIGIMRCERY